MAAEQLYLEDSYLKEFDAYVKDVKENFVFLDRTAFYPQGGGQPSDTGEIVSKENGEVYKVLFVKKVENNEAHEVDKEGLSQGMLVKCKINWKRRHLFMRFHTAAHILSGVIHQKTKAQITGNQIAEEKTRIDFNIEKFDREALQSYADEANEIIAKNLTVKIKAMPREEAFKIPSMIKLKKMLPESIQEIRVVDIVSFDQQACAGTHVGNTSEIGKIEIIKAENKGKGNRRIYFKLV